MTGATLTFAGSGDTGHIATWSVTEEATPHSLADRSGGVGSLSVSAQAVGNSVYLNDCAVTLDDDGNEWEGRVLDARCQGAAVSFTAESSLRFLAAPRTARPVGRWLDPLSMVGAGVLSGMSSLAWDASGNLFAYDPATYSVRKFTEAGGVWTQVAVTAYTTAGSADGQFGGDRAYLAVDGSGNVYATDSTNNRVQKFTNGLVFTAKQGSSGSGNTQYSSPAGIAFDASTGYLLVLDPGNTRVKRINTSLTYVAQQSTGVDHRRIAVNSTGQFAAGGNTSGGPVLLFSTWGGPDEEFPDFDVRGLAFDSDDFLWASASSRGMYRLEPPTMTVVGTYDSWASGDSPFGGIIASLAISADDRLAMTDAGFSGALVLGYTGGPVELTIPLSQAIETYVRLCDPDEIHAYSYDAATDPEVAFPGWIDNVWTKLKELCAVYRLEIYYQNGTVHVGDIGARELNVTNRTAPKFQPGSVMPARSIGVINHNITAGSGLVMYDAEVAGTIHTVAVDRTVTVTLTTPNFPVLLNNPIPVDSAPIAAGEYAVQDSTGAAVPATDWRANGGDVRVSVSDTSGHITFTLIGPFDTIAGFTGPFSLATGTGKTRKPTLSIIGTGVTTDPILVTIPTGADETRITRDSGGTLDSPFVGDLDKAYDAGVWAATDFLFDATLTLTIPRQTGLTFGDYVGRLFTYQAARWRVMSAKITAVGVEITARWYTTVGDVDDLWNGLTVGDVDTAWDGYLLRDTNMTPLKAS